MVISSFITHSPQRLPRPEPGQEIVSDYRVVTPGFFPTLGIPLLSGALLPEQIRADGPRPVGYSNDTPGGYAEYMRLTESLPETRVIASLKNLLDHQRFEPGFGGFDVPVPGRRFLLEIQQGF